MRIPVCVLANRSHGMKSFLLPTLRYPTQADFIEGLSVLGFAGWKLRSEGPWPLGLGGLGAGLTAAAVLSRWGLLQGYEVTMQSRKPEPGSHRSLRGQGGRGETPAQHLRTSS